MHLSVTAIAARANTIIDQVLIPAVYSATAPVSVERWDVPGEPVPPAQAIMADYAPAAIGDPWGPAWGTTWLKIHGQVPTEWAGRDVELITDLGYETNMWAGGVGFNAEGMAYRPDGQVIKGIHPRSRYVTIADPARGGEDVDLYIEAAANPDMDRYPDRGAHLGQPDQPIYRLARLELAVREPEVHALLIDLQVLTELMDTLPDTDGRKYEIATAVSDGLDAIDLGDVAGSAAAARNVLAPALAVPARASAHQMGAIGNAHIDSAWLWPLRETKRKVARTIANAAELSSVYPDYTFAMSQAAQLEWMKLERPDVFALAGDLIKAGRIVPVGGMWCEPDGNLPGGEALARQLSYGKRFFRDEFDYDVTVGWMPDSFGYTAALPQLLASAGIKWFLTQKMSWNDTNTFPHHTFWWEGIDGTRMFTHFPPADTYNAEVTGKEIALAAGQFREKGRTDRSLLLFGYGDGGGGPTREMIERVARFSDLDGSARLHIQTPEEFFAAAEADYPNAPVWVGELYLELHRGTSTSQVEIKQGNRRNEHLLREAELWSTLATVRTGAEYPYEKIDRLWKDVLLLQFHDILPGSSIAWVNHEAVADHAAISAALTEIIEQAVTTLAGKGDTTLVFNAAPHARGGVPALGAAEPSTDELDVEVETDDTGFVLDNGLVRVTIDQRGLITSARDASGREAIAPNGAGNLLTVHQDLPRNWDAWDIDEFYRHTQVDLTDVDSITLDDADPLAPSVKVTRHFGNSTVTEWMTLKAGSTRIDCETEIDWHEEHKLVKAGFDLDVRADEELAEIQFGHVHRPTHVNTTWQSAQFEKFCHRWFYLGEPGYGHAIVNATSYGHDVLRDVRPDGGTTTTGRVTLVRGPKKPDPEADAGRHTFRYSLVVGATVHDAIREGYRVNLPERIVTGAAEVAPAVTVDNQAIVVEAVKLADDRSGDVIVRLYESLGGRAAARVRPGFAAKSVGAVNLLEEQVDGPVTDDAGRAVIELRPFEVITLRFAIK